MTTLTLIGLAIALFVSTNLDDVFVLIVFFSDSQFKAREIVIGQLAGIAALTVGSFVLSLASVVMPTKYIGFLGLLPFVLGLRMFIRALRKKKKEDDEAANESKPHDRIGILAVAGVTIANGADNVTAYVPFFATRPLWHSAIAMTVFVVMTGVWCFLAHFLVRRPILGRPIRKYGTRVLPFVLMALGVYMFVESDVLSLF